MCFPGGNNGGSNGGLIDLLPDILGTDLEKAKAKAKADEAKKEETKTHLRKEDVRRSRMQIDTGDGSGAVSLAGLPLGRTKLGR